MLVYPDHKHWRSLAPLKDKQPVTGDVVLFDTKMRTVTRRASGGQETVSVDCFLITEEAYRRGPSTLSYLIKIGCVTHDKARMKGFL